MSLTPQIILASASEARQRLLAIAGIAARAIPSGIDEGELKARKSEVHGGSEELAVHLAEAKALAVSAIHGEDLVLGADQILLLQDVFFDKPRSMAEARAQLLKLRGTTHRLVTAVAAARRGRVLWFHCDSAKLSMRHFSEAFLENYLAAMGDELLSTVGAYKIEGPGIQLFDRIEGDYFTILGLPLLPLLSFLRSKEWLSE
jgi:nucleoside triphosphate pyrophosphatase